MASRKCGWRGCANRVSDSSPHDLCWQHRSLSASSAPIDETSLRDEAPELFLVQSIHHTPEQQFSNSLVDATPVHSSYAKEIAAACYKWNQSLSNDGTVPAFGSILDSPEALGAFKENLIAHGIARERITTWRFEGGSRRDPYSGVKQEFGPGEVHHALVLDKGTSREVVIDPSISKYAPVYDRNSPVDDQLASGMTPFGDSPWIGTMDEYVNGGFFNWSSRREVG